MEVPEVGVFIVNLDDALAMGQDLGIPYVSLRGRSGGVNFKCEGAYFEKLIANPRVDYTRMALSDVDPVRGWDRTA